MGYGGETTRLCDAARGQSIDAPLHHGSDVRVVAVAISPNDTRIATGGRHGSLRLWDAATGKPIGAPMRQLDMVRTVAFSPDGSRVVTGNQADVVQIWNLNCTARGSDPGCGLWSPWLANPHRNQ
ncbi:MAG: hypothetical protein IIC50_15495 [Planctomycetes bacterium]|nr:hypothetical protein [Planctomycetota bacterium]